MNNLQELEKVTDFVEDKGIDEKNLNNALSGIKGKSKISSDDFKINEKDLEFIIKEFMFEKPRALKVLKQAKGELKRAIRLIIEA